MVYHQNAFSSKLFIFASTEERHLHNKTKLTKQHDDAKIELNAVVNKLGVVEEERLDGIARMEASLKRADDLEADIEAEMKQTQEDLRKREESFRAFEKSFLAKQQTWNGLLVQ